MVETVIAVVPRVNELATGISPATLIWIAALFGLTRNRRVVTGVGVGACAVVAVWALTVPSGVAGEWTFLEFALTPVSVDEASRVTGLAFASFGTVALTYLYSTDGEWYHTTTALVYIGAAVWGVFAGDWLSLLVSWELMAIASTLLVWVHGGRAVRVGFRYALVHAVGGALFAAGIALHIVATGVPGGIQYADGITNGIPAGVAGLGIAINAALIGVHLWLPDTYASPHVDVGVSVVLSAYTTKLAVYAAFRAFPGENIVLAYVGGAMAVFGVAYALAQKDARRLLAYHIQAQVGYMLAGIGVGSSLGAAGAFAHLFNNVLFKGLLFMIAGIIVYRTGTATLSKSRRLSSETPALVGTFVIAAASITAVPGTNGFISKGMILDAALEGGHGPLRWLLLVGAVGTVVSFIKFGYLAGFRGSSASFRDISRLQAVAMVPIAAVCVALGVLYGPFFELLPASDQWSTTPYSQRHIYEAAVLLGIGGAAFVIARPVLDRLDGGRDIDTVRDPAVFWITRSAVGATSAVFASTAAAGSTIQTRAAGVVYKPVTSIAAVLPRTIGARYRSHASEGAGTTGIQTSVTYRLVAVICCLLTGLVLGLGFR